MSDSFTPSGNLIEDILHLLDAGCNIQRISYLIGVSERTVNRCMNEHDIPRWTSISDVDLLGAICHVINTSHPGIGENLVESHLCAMGLRVQRHRIRDALHSLGAIRYARHRVHRMQYNVNLGPYWNWHADQNEKMVRWRIFILSIIDGYTRHCTHHELLTDLTGSTHTTFFVNALRLSGRAPDHLTIDGTACWNGAEEIMTLVHVGRPPCEHVDINGVSMPVHRVQRSKSVHNTPVERHWREINKLLLEYKNALYWLESIGQLEAGRSPNYLDLHCVHAVFLGPISADLDRHYASLLMRKKRKYTKDPNFPNGTFRATELLARHPPRGTLVI